MGAQTFVQYETGTSPKDAFITAREQAFYDYGNRGYTGTLAEKDSFVVIKVPSDWLCGAEDYAEKLIDDCDSRITNKWGPAGCIKSGEGQYMFFGWASC